MAFWLFKTEPDVFSIENLARAPQQTARWDDIRNYQARNFLRDRVAPEDRVFIYHSQCRPTGLVGLAEVAGRAYADPAQFKPDSPYYDPKASPGNPRWYCVDVHLLEIFPNMVTLAQIKQLPQLANMVLLKQPRLSVQPVSDTEAQELLRLAAAMRLSEI